MKGLGCTTRTRLPGDPAANRHHNDFWRPCAIAKSCLSEHYEDMVLEHALLDLIPGEEAAFEGAFAEAKEIISAADGFRSLRPTRCAECRHRYLLLVEWDSAEHHTVGFRVSPAYQQWRRLLHHFCEPFPKVEHYEPVAAVPGAS